LPFQPLDFRLGRLDLGRKAGRLRLDELALRILLGRANAWSWRANSLAIAWARCAWVSVTRTSMSCVPATRLTLTWPRRTCQRSSNPSSRAVARRIGSRLISSE